MTDDHYQVDTGKVYTSHMLIQVTYDTCQNEIISFFYCRTGSGELSVVLSTLYTAQLFQHPHALIYRRQVTVSSLRLSGLNPIPLPQLKTRMEASVPGATLSSQHAPCLINTIGTHTCTHYVSVNHVHTHTHTQTLKTERLFCWTHYGSSQLHLSNLKLHVTAPSNYSQNVHKHAYACSLQSELEPSETPGAMAILPSYRVSDNCFYCCLRLLTLRFSISIVMSA